MCVSRSLLPTLPSVNTMSDYYTPAHIIQAAVDFFGSEISLYLCSDETANKTVKANVFYTDYTALASASAYRLSIWCNPPYTREFITPFFEWYAKHIPIAIENGCEVLTLVNTQSSAKWFHSLLNGSDSMAVFKKRIAFINPETLLPATNNRYDQTLFMSSPRCDANSRLCKAFRGQAKVVRL